MRLNIDDLAIDDDAVEKGVWTETPVFKAEVCIRSSGSIAFTTAWAAQTAILRSEYGSEHDAPEDAKHASLAVAINDGILVSWRNIHGKDGELMEHDHEVALGVLLSPKSKRLLNDIFMAANNIRNFKEKQEEGILGN